MPIPGPTLRDENSFTLHTHTHTHAHAHAHARARVNAGPTIRAENSFTSRHLAEFWMIEPEIAFADLEVRVVV